MDEFGRRLDYADEEEVLEAVEQACAVVNKQGEDKNRFIQAIDDIVNGRLNIKEASIEYQFPATTIHPYVHKSRHLLGERAPPLKNPPRSTGVRPLGSQHSIQTASGMQSLSSRAASKFAGNLVSGLSLLHHNLETDNSIDDQNGTDSRSRGMEDEEGLGLGDIAGSSLFCTPSKFDGIEVNDPNDDEEENLNKNNVYNSANNADFDEAIASNFTEVDPEITHDSISDSQFAIKLSQDDESDEETNTLQIDTDEGDCKTSSNVTGTSKQNNIRTLDDLTPEEVAQETLAVMPLEDSMKPNLFMAILSVMTEICSVTEAAHGFTVDEEELSTCIEYARQMIKSTENEKVYEGIISTRPANIATDMRQVKTFGQAKQNFGHNLVLSKPKCTPAPPSHLDFDKPVTTDEIQAVAERVVSASTYTHEAKDRLVKAVIETVENNVASTNAAHKYCIPFSTLHPYVKKTRIELGLVDETTIVDEYGKRRTVPIVDAQGKPVTKRSRVLASQTLQEITEEKPFPFGLNTNPVVNTITPFKPVKIPDSWKNQPELLEKAVEQALTNCKYDSDAKRVLLKEAVLEVVSGRGTMKSAAAKYEVPFTTLQTYFHRARVLIVNQLGDDPCPRKEGFDGPEQSPFNRGLRRNDDSYASFDDSGSQTLNPRKRSALDSITARLQQGTDSESESSQPSSKRRNDAKSNLDDIFGNDNTADSWDDGPTCMTMNSTSRRQSNDFDSPTIVYRTSASGTSNTGNTTVDIAPRIPDDWCVDDGSQYFTVERAVEKATKNTHYHGVQKDLMIEALVDAVYGRCSLKDAARDRRLGVGSMHTYFHRARSMVDAVRGGCRPTDVMQMTASQATAAARAIKDQTSGLFDFDRSSMTQEEMCNTAIERVVKSSLYPPEQKERLRKAVVTVILHAKTINYAANMYSLPSSTVHPYVHRVRAALGDDCPPQASSVQPHIYSFDGATIETKDVVEESLRRESQSPSGSGSFNRIKLPEIGTRASMRDTIRQIRAGSSVAAPFKKESLTATLAAVTHAKQVATSINPSEISKAEKIVLRLIRSSLYGEDGRKKLFKAIMMVIGDSATCSEAARTYGIPPSTIQPYVQKTRGALSEAELEPSVSSPATSRRPAGSRSNITDEDESNLATIDEIADLCAQAVDEADVQYVQRLTDDRKQQFIDCMVAILCGEFSPKEAVAQYRFHHDKLVQLVEKVRLGLGIRAPPTGMSTGLQQHEQLADSIDSYSPVSQHSQPPEDPTQDTNQPAALAIKRELKAILDRYNYKSDRAVLMRAVLMNVGDRKSLAECCSITGLAQTTLSTYTRIARLFLEKSTIENYEEERHAISNGLASPFAMKTDDSLSSLPTVLENGSISPEPVATPNVRATVHHASSQEPEEDFMALFEIDDTNDDEFARDERRMRACIDYVVSSQFRRPKPAQDKLSAAIEDVLLNGLASVEAVKTRQGVSEHVIDAYVSRVKVGCVCLDDPLKILRDRCRDDFNDAVSSLVVLSKAEEVDVRPSYDGDECIRLPEHIESLLVDYLRELEKSNFPLGDKFCGALVRCALDIKATDGATLQKPEAWSEWWSSFQQKYQFKSGTSV